MTGERQEESEVNHFMLRHGPQNLYVEELHTLYIYKQTYAFKENCAKEQQPNVQYMGWEI